MNAGEVDAKRLCIDGRSAGGYTTMAALVFSDTFTAGATLFGVIFCSPCYFSLLIVEVTDYVSDYRCCSNCSSCLFSGFKG